MKQTKQKIHVRVALTIAVGAAVIAMVSSVFFYQFSFKSEVSDAKQGIDQLFSTVENTASAAVYLDNEVLAQEVVNGLASNDLVLSAILESDTGLRVAINTALSKPEKTSRFAKAELIKFELIHPFSDDHKIGMLSVQADQHFIEASASARAETQALLTIFQSIIIALLVLLLVNRTLTRPLKKVAYMLHRIDPSEPHKLDCPEGHERDEIGELVADINVLLGSVENHIDIERTMREESEALERQFRLIYEEASAGIFLINQANEVITANPAFHGILNTGLQLSNRPIEQQKISDFFEDRQLVQDMLTSLRGSKMHMTTDSDLRLNLDGQHWVHCLFTKVIDEAGENLIEGILYDVTQRISREQNARFEADHDTLTGLCNRRSGEREINQIIHAANRLDSSMAVLLIDLDGFKPINDTYGHDAGDVVLVEVSNRLSEVVRVSDIVARWGGDEFLIALDQVDVEDDKFIKLICQKVLDVLRTPIKLEDGSVCTIGGSIGVARYPLDGHNLEQLIEMADRAMYHAKNSGKNRFTVHGEY